MRAVYRVRLEPQDNGGYTVVVPVLPEAHTQGDDVVEALANAREVIELALEQRVAKGLPIPHSETKDVGEAAAGNPMCARIETVRVVVRSGASHGR